MANQEQNFTVKLVEKNFDASKAVNKATGTGSSATRVDFSFTLPISGPTTPAFPCASVTVRQPR